MRQETGVGLTWDLLLDILHTLDSRIAALARMDLFVNKWETFLYELKICYDGECKLYPALRDEIENAALEVHGVHSGVLLGKTVRDACERMREAYQQAFDAVRSKEGHERFLRKATAHELQLNQQADRALVRRKSQAKSGKAAFRRQSLEEAAEDVNLRVLADDVLALVKLSSRDGPTYVVDYGCGEGPLFSAMTSGPNCHWTQRVHYVGLDVSRDCIAAAAASMGLFSDKYAGAEFRVLGDTDGQSAVAALQGQGCLCVLRHVLHEVALAQLPVLLRNVVGMARPDGAIRIEDLQTLRYEEPRYVFYDEEDVRSLCVALNLQPYLCTSVTTPGGSRVLKAILKPTLGTRVLDEDSAKEVCIELFRRKLDRYHAEYDPLYEKQLKMPLSPAENRRYFDLLHCKNAVDTELRILKSRA